MNKYFKDILKKSKKTTITKAFPYILIATAVVGLIASFVLTVEHINLLEDPEHTLSCSINPVLACGPIMQSDEATAFGFPNPLIGLVTFGAQLLLGVVMLAGAKMKAWFWKLYSLTFVGALAFTIWLMIHSIYFLEALCVYCLAVWISTILVSWYFLQFILAEKIIKLPNKKLQKFIRDHHGDILILFYLILFVMILSKFWYYYGPKLGF